MKMLVIAPFCRWAKTAVLKIKDENKLKIKVTVQKLFLTVQ